MTTANKSEKDRVIVFDTTLRDGEQCPGATMTFEEKLEIAEMLDDMGVDVIEAGFPITSEGDFQAVSEIARRSKNAVIAGLSRANPKDIDRCAEAVKFAKTRPRPHRDRDLAAAHARQLNMTPEQVMELLHCQRHHAPATRSRVEWSAEDGTAARWIISAASSKPSSRPAPPRSTFRPVGYTVPEEYTRFMRTLIERGRIPTRRYFSVHCHNDSHGGGEFAGRHRRRARGRSSAPSTASASGPAMPRWKKS